MEWAFHPHKLALAREARGMFKCDLAMAAGLSEKVVGEHESGRRPVSVESIGRYSRALGFPTSFFECDNIQRVRSVAVNFRARSKMSARSRDKSISCASIVINTFEPWLQRRFTIPEPDIPDFYESFNSRSAEMVSFDLRNRWGLGEMPIKNMVHLVEAHGVRIYTIPESNRESDAFSLWWDNTPYIFFDNKKTAERARFDIAHELGHLVMHKSVDGEDVSREDIERQANTFASYFLMPSSAFLATAGNCITMPQVIRCKKYWNVSALACIYRMKEQNVISEWLNRKFNMLCSMQGKSNEPDPSPFESSKIIQRVMEILSQDGLHFADIADELNLDAGFLKGFLFDMDTVSRFGHLRIV